MPELYSYTAQRVADDVKNKFGDAAGVRLRDDMLIAWINDGQREIGLRTSFKESMAVTNLLAGIDTYDLAQLLRNERIFSFGSIMVNGTKIEMIAHQEFLRRIEQNDLPQTTSIYPLYATEYGDKLKLWPVPTVDVVRGITIYGTALPDDVTALDDELTVPDRLFSSLTATVLAKAYEFDERPEDSTAKITQAENEIVREMGRQDASPVDSYPVIDWGDEDGY